MGIVDSKCKFEGLVLPLFGEPEMEWPNILRLILYLMGLVWIFLGVGLISDVFMNGIEKITSAKRRVQNKATGKTITVYVWNATVANLTLMALGSSAPEILLSLIEITTANFMLGPLGAGTIVGSAAFNLLIISAVCVLAIPDGEVRYIKEVPVYIVTSSFSVFAYLWLMFIVMFSSADVCEAWEAAVTLLFTPILVILAYLADRGYFSKREDAYVEQDQSTAIPDDVTDNELAAIEQEIRDQHGASLTPEQVVKIMQAQYFQKRSRAYYRHVAMEVGVHGKKHDRRSVAPPDMAVQEAIGTGDDLEEGGNSKKMCELQFATDKYCYLENCGNAKIVVVRGGPVNCKCTVKYTTREGTAKIGTDYEHQEGTITFEKNQREHNLLIPIKDDVAYEEDEEFYIDLSDPQVEDTSSCQARLGPIQSVTVVIIDDDQPGQLRFKSEEVSVVEDAASQTFEVTVERFNGATGTIGCSYHTDMMNAVDGVNYEGTKGHLEFEPNVQTLSIPVTINARGIVDKVSFNVVLTDPKGCKFDDKTDGGEEQCICHVTIKGKMGETRRNLFTEMKARAVSANAIMGSRNYLQQFKDALFQVGDDDDEDEEEAGEEGAEKGGPSPFDYFMHIIAIPWKLLFAFVPPVDYCGGWACFFGALVMIAVVTGLVSDMANLVGCCFDILPETAAITFVALGTSLPDTFASMTAAMMDPYADASIGNVTGSNSINVFMGIGLAWSLAAFKWQLNEPDEHWRKGFAHLTDGQKDNVYSFLDCNGKDKPCSGNAIFITPAGSIWFNLMVFSVNAFFAIQHLYARRRRFGGELGGPKKGVMGQWFSAGFLIFQWFIYLGTSVLFARGFADPVTYTQIADMEAEDMSIYK